MTSGCANRRKILDLKLEDCFWLLMMNALLFSQAIDVAIGFSYIDEIATVVCVCCAILKIRKHLGENINPFVGRALFCLCLTVFIAFTSNYVAGVNVSIAPILIDLFTCVKFPLTLISAFLIFRDKEDLRLIFELEAKFLVLILLIFGIVNLFVQIGNFGTTGRYGFRASFQFVFGHPESLNLAVLGILLLLVLDPKGNKLWILGSLFVMCLSFRSKGLGFVALALFLLMTWNKSGRLKVYQVAIGLFAAVLIGYDQFSYYFTTDGAARGELTRVAILIANRFFPFGSGFATYGSNITSDMNYYSPLYYEYGLYTVQGITPGHTNFLSDVYWPTILGQFGWIGSACYCLLLIFLITFVYRSCQSSGQRLACVFCFSYILISSTAASCLFHPTSVYLACCLGLALSVRSSSQSSPLKSTW